jgi:hypothetical protein
MSWFPGVENALPVSSGLLLQSGARTMLAASTSSSDVSS